MKILKVFNNLINPTRVEKGTKNVPVCPVIYDRNNVTADEFREYIHWLAKNNINRTVYEPDRFVTKAEREASEKKKSELNEYKNFVHNLAKNNVNRTFLC